MNDPVTRLRKAALGANTMLPFLAVLFFGQGIRAIGQDIDSYHGASSMAMIVGDCLMFVGLPLCLIAIFVHLRRALRAVDAELGPVSATKAG